MEIKKYFRIKYYREILNLKYQFFRKQDLLNIRNEISISEKKTKYFAQLLFILIFYKLCTTIVGDARGSDGNF